MVLHALHLCSGYGGFELALRLAGIPAVTVAHVERDSYAAAVLVARMADQTLDQAPVWSDIDTFDPEPFAGRVDLVTAGLPCQPFSAAGQRKGLDDHRHLWPMARRIIADVGPRLVLLENVPDVVSAGWLPHVCADLADLGFDAEWGLYSAAAVGAPHQRQRFWLLAFPADDGRSRRDLRVQPRLAETIGRPMADTDVDGLQVVGQRGRGTGEGVPRDAHRSGGADVGDARRPRRPEVAGGTPRHEAATLGGDVADGACQDVADTDGTRHEGPGPAEPAGRSVARQRSPFPPGPDDADGWRHWIAQGGPQPQVRRSTHGRPLGLGDALHCLGNGLVPSVAAHALLQLADRAGVCLI